MEGRSGESVDVGCGDGGVDGVADSDGGGVGGQVGGDFAPGGAVEFGHWCVVLEGVMGGEAVAGEGEHFGVAECSDVPAC